jgi:hypothetical protein
MVFGLMSTMVPSLVVVRPPVLHAIFPDLLTLCGWVCAFGRSRNVQKSQFLTWTTETSGTPDGQLYPKPLLSPKAASGAWATGQISLFIHRARLYAYGSPWFEGVRDTGGLRKRATRFFD